MMTALFTLVFLILITITLSFPATAENHQQEARNSYCRTECIGFNKLSETTFQLPPVSPSGEPAAYNYLIHGGKHHV